MAAPFDPYHRWLGIHPDEQPADHYRLLGLRQFEADVEVIRDAAERQMSHVRRYELGEHSRRAQDILNELARAKACLLDAQKKTAYDNVLQSAVSEPEGISVEDSTREVVVADEAGPLEPLPVSDQPWSEETAALIEEIKSTALDTRKTPTDEQGSPSDGHTRQEEDAAVTIGAPSETRTQPDYDSSANTSVRPAKTIDTTELADEQSTMNLGVAQSSEEMFARRGDTATVPFKIAPSPSKVAESTRRTLLRSVHAGDHVLKRMSGEDNAIVHNFLRAIFAVGIVGIVSLGLRLAAVAYSDKPPNVKKLTELKSVAKTEPGKAVSGQGDFQIGRMMPSNGKQGKKKKSGRKNNKTRPGPPVNEDIFDGPPVASDGRTFAVLLGGQNDDAGTLLAFDADQIAASLAGAMGVTDVPNAKLANVYFALCDLGQHLAHAANRADPRTSNHRIDAEGLILRVALPEKQGSLSGFSHQWLQFDKRPPGHKDNMGVFLVGKVQRIASMGLLFAIELEMTKRTKDKDGNPTTLTSRVVVVTPERPDLHVHDMVGVLGSAVRDATAKLPGYNPQADLKEFAADPNVIVLAGATAKLRQGN